MTGTAGARPERIRVTARLWLENGAHALLARSIERGHRFLPGGEVEPGEAAAQAAARELEEETGISGDRLRVAGALGVLEQTWTERGLALHQIDVVLAASVEGLSAGDPVPSLEGHLAFEWWSLDALGAADLWPGALLGRLPGWRAAVPAAFASDMMAPHGGCVVVSSGKRER